MRADTQTVYEAIFGDVPYVDLKTRRAPGMFHRRRAASSNTPKTRQAITPAQRLANMSGQRQALVKVIKNGGVKSRGALGKQLNYVTRGGEIDGTIGDNGIEGVWTGANRVSELIEVWSDDFDEMDEKGVTNKTYHLVVSFPAGTDTERARMAGEAFAASFSDGTFGDVYRYVAVQHTDTASPHTHVIVNRLGESGTCLHISNYGLTVQALRERQVEVSAGFGIALNATPRWSRPNTAAPVALGRLKADRGGRTLKNRALDEDSSRIQFESFEKSKWEDILKALKSCGEIFSSRDSQVIAAFVELSARTQLTVGDSKMSQETIARNQAEVQAMLQRQQIAVSRTLSEARDRVDGLPEGPAKERAQLAYEEVQTQLLPLLSGSELERWQHARGDEFTDPVERRQGAVDAVRDVHVVTDLSERDPRGLVAREADASGAENTASPDAIAKVATQRLAAADADVARLVEGKGLNGARYVAGLEALQGASHSERKDWEGARVKEYMGATGATETQATKVVRALDKEVAGIYKDTTKDIRQIKPDVLLTRKMAEPSVSKERVSPDREQVAKSSRSRETPDRER